jgi:excinuclease ABC subunit B
MQAAAESLDFEKAAVFRDRLQVLKDIDLGLKPPLRSLIESVEVKKEEPEPVHQRRNRMRRRRR